jgi:Protein of unknown function (DUF4239)
MNEFAEAGVMLLLLIGSSVFGVTVRSFLAERHRSRETTDLVRLVVTMLVTFAALVLGLLTDSVKASFDGIDNDLRSLSIQLIQLDRSLLQYGGDADAARALLRAYTATAIASTWRSEAKPPGDYYPREVSPTSADSIESPGLTDMLSRLESDLRGLEPADAKHRHVFLTAINQYEQLMGTRWKLIEEAHSSISEPFFVVLAFWLAIVFASFGLSAPRNFLSYLMVFLGALSIASVIYVILDLDTPFSGVFMVSSQPMRDALAQMRE